MGVLDIKGVEGRCLGTLDTLHTHTHTHMFAPSRLSGVCSQQSVLFYACLVIPFVCVCVVYSKVCDRNLCLYFVSCHVFEQFSWGLRML